MKQAREARDMRNSGFVIRKERAGTRIAKSKRALTKVISNTQQEVDLPERASSSSLGGCTASFLSRDQNPPPSVGGRVSEGTEHGETDGRLQPPLHQRQRWVKRVCVRARQV